LNKLKDGDTGFSIPENYFAQFEGDLQENNLISGFTTPEDYFDQFDESVLVQLDMKVNRLTGFKTPDNYFKNLDQNLLLNLNTKKPAKIIKLITNKNFRILSYSIAASLLLFFSLRNLKSDDKGFNVETIEISEIESWMDDDLISFSSYDISETFNDIHLTVADNYTEDDILDYLDGENIENLILEN